ncbi:hypothetical protein HK405_015367, partial [Cladochytrium tenue]
DEYLECVEASAPRLEGAAPTPALGPVKLGNMLSLSKTLNIPSSKWIHYETAGVPTGFFAVGDSMICLNPAYAQGMTMACQAVSTLDRSLRSNRTNVEVTTYYYKLLAARAYYPWHIPLALDWLNPAVRPKTVRFRTKLLTYVMLWAGERSSWAAARTMAMAAFSMRTGSMLGNRYDLLNPYILWNLLTCTKPKWTVALNSEAEP